MLNSMGKIWSRAELYIWGVVLILGGCSQQVSAQAPSLTSAEAQGVSAPASEPEEASFRARASPENSQERILSPLIDEREPDVTKSLPELSFRHLGMHIGGESNSAESKKPWLLDIESGEESLLLCYRLVRAPQKGGSYGIDLYVGSKGGAPDIRGSRQKIGDDDFEQCMRAAFFALDFHGPGKPTVLSYSLLFRLATNQ